MSDRKNPASVTNLKKILELELTALSVLYTKGNNFEVRIFHLFSSLFRSFYQILDPKDYEPVIVCLTTYYVEKCVWLNDGNYFWSLQMFGRLTYMLSEIC